MLTMGDNGASARSFGYHWRKRISHIMEFAVQELSLTRREAFTLALSVTASKKSMDQFKVFLKRRIRDKDCHTRILSSTSILAKTA